MQQKPLNPLHFTEQDKKMFIDFLNAVATHAKFNLDTKELCDYFKLLAHMQQAILPKLDANILEIKEIGKLKDKKTEKLNKKSAK